MLGHARILRSHCLLKVDGTLHGIDDAGELDKHAVAHELENAAAMLRDHGHQDSLEALLQQRHRARFVLLHEAAEADHISSQYRGKAALGAFLKHNGHSLSENAINEIVLAAYRKVYRPNSG